MIRPCRGIGSNLPWYWFDPCQVLTTRLEVGKLGLPSRRNRSTEVPRSVHRSLRVGRPKSPSRSTEVPPVGRPSRPSRSTEIAKEVGNLLIRPAKPSDHVRTTLRPPLSDSLPHSKQLSALLPITLRLTLTQVRRRFSSSKAERVSTRGRRQCRRAGWGHLGGPTRQGRPAGLAHVNVPTPTLSAGRPLPYRRADFPKPACRECQGSRMIVRRGSRDSYGGWRGGLQVGCEPPQDGRGLFKPLTRDVQWIGSSSSMDGRASVNGLSSAIQWMERWDSMDRTSHFNGLTITPPFRRLHPSPASLLLPRPGDSGRNRS